MNERPIAVEFMSAENGWILQFWEPSKPHEYAAGVAEPRFFVAATVIEAMEIVSKQVNLHFVKEPEDES